MRHGIAFLRPGMLNSRHGRANVRLGRVNLRPKRAYLRLGLAELQSEKVKFVNLWPERAIFDLERLIRGLGGSI